MSLKWHTYDVHTYWNGAHARQETARIQIALRNFAIYPGITRHRAIRTSNRLYDGIVKPQMLMTNCFIVFYMNFYMDIILCSETHWDWARCAPLALALIQGGLSAGIRASVVNSMCRDDLIVRDRDIFLTITCYSNLWELKSVWWYTGSITCDIWCAFQRLKHGEKTNKHGWVSHTISEKTK